MLNVMEFLMTYIKFSLLVIFCLVLPGYAQAQLEIRRGDQVVLAIDQMDDLVFETTFKTGCSCVDSLKNGRVYSGAIYGALRAQDHRVFLEVLRGHEHMGERPLVSQTVSFTFPGEDGDHYRAMELGAFGVAEQEGKPGVVVENLTCDGAQGAITVRLDSLLLKKLPSSEAYVPYLLDDNDTLTISGHVNGVLMQNKKLGDCDVPP